MKFKKEKITIEYTSEKCNSCGNIVTRNFKDGDVLFSISGSCGKCSDDMMIHKIYCEIKEP